MCAPEVSLRLQVTPRWHRQCRGLRARLFSSSVVSVHWDPVHPERLAGDTGCTSPPGHRDAEELREAGLLCHRLHLPPSFLRLALFSDS